VSAALSTGVGRAPLRDRRNDLYETPSCATLALLREEPLLRRPQKIWEPAAGRGAIVRVLRAHGHEVVASDLIDYGDPTCFSRQDFLLEHKAPQDCECILTNPPFSLAEEFVAHALELCPRVIMLLRLAFLESERRSRILDAGTFARVHIFRKRLPMMHRDGWEGPKASSAMAFAWFVWDRTHNGPPTLHRVDAPAGKSADFADFAGGRALARQGGAP
jgi:hypothetical protein